MLLSLVSIVKLVRKRLGIRPSVSKFQQCGTWRREGKGRRWFLCVIFILARLIESDIVKQNLYQVIIRFHNVEMTQREAAIKINRLWANKAREIEKLMIRKADGQYEPILQ